MSLQSTTLAYREVSFCQSTEGEVRLGVKTEEGNLANWIGYNDMKLYKVAPKAEASPVPGTLFTGPAKVARRMV